ncbi:hypothetical protein RI129_005307 [Pyrocoelia pectoralis]|uniref:Uncharacterized protein n=1 Tax=Pyrocoelia pectoralis TaxID=417401 RepID=A0AAN7VJL9_9COLE
MLSPEIWNFKAPDSLVKVEKGNIVNNNCFNTIQKLHHNHLVSVVLPDTLRVPQNICETLKNDCEYYKISNVGLDELVNINFINAFVRKGIFISLSINERIDCDDCMCITPNGFLLLSLTKETYESLGLEGTPSHYYNTKQRYVVSINLLSNHFKPGKKNYDRTKDRLLTLKKMTLLINWEPPHLDICPSSVAKYFDDLKFDVQVCLPDFQMRTNYTIKVPNFTMDNIHEFVEWLGMFSLESDLGGGGESYLSTYETPQPYQEYGQVKFLQWRGFFSSQQINKLLEVLISHLKDEEKPWISLYVQGFSDVVVGWDLQEHHYYTNGDNGYVIVLNSEDYMVYQHMCSKKSYK